MKVFVTGGAGYVGSVTVDHLIQNGHAVTVFDNLERGHRQAVHSEATLVIGDLRDQEAVHKAVAEARPDAIIHFAAYAYVAESMQEPLNYFQNNVSGSLNLIRAAQNNAIQKIVFSSSCAVYGVPQSCPITEKTPRRPVSPYGESKQIVESMLDWVHRIHGMDVVALRYFNACGAAGHFGEDHRPETHLIPLALKAAAHDGVFTLYGDQYETPDGTCIRDYVHVEDLAQAHVLALKPGLSTVFNLGNGRGFSVREALKVAEAVTGKTIAVRVAAARPGDPPVLIADNQKAREVLGWTPHHTELTEIIEDAWRWMQQHPSGFEGSVKSLLTGDG